MSVFSTAEPRLKPACETGHGGACCHPTLGRHRPEDLDFKVIVSYVGNRRPIRATCDPPIKQNKTNRTYNEQEWPSAVIVLADRMSLLSTAGRTGPGKSLKPRGNVKESCFQNSCY